MKKIIYIVLFISALAFGQEGSTQVTVENYQHLKTHGLLNSTTPYQFVDLLTPNPKTHPLNPEKNALCNCLIQLDNTFSLAMAPNDDASSPYIQLPFTFNFYGTPYDSIVINNNGNILVKATRIGSDTELARITRMILAAQSEKAPAQQLADKISRVFVPVVLLL